MAHAVGEVCDGAGLPPAGTVQSTYADAVFQPGDPLANPPPVGALAVGDLFGSAIAVGDFNSDGIDDMAVGAPGVNHAGMTDVGAVMVYFGQLDMQPLCAATGCLPSQLTTRDADVILWGATANAKFGTALAAVGDLNPGTGAAGHAEELLVGGNGIAMVVDVQAAAAAAAFSVPTPLEELTPTSGSTTTRFGHLVGSMEVEGVRVLWVGEGLAHALHVYNDLTDALTTPDLTITWTTQSPQNVYLSAAVGVADWDHDPLATPDLAVACAQCSSAMGNVKVFQGGDLLGEVDLSGVNAISSFSGASQTGASLAGFPDGRLAIGATHFSPGGRIYVAAGSSDPTNSGVFSPYGMWDGASQAKLGTATAVIDIDNQNGPELLGGGPETLQGGVRRGIVSFTRNPAVTGILSSEWSMLGPANGLLGSGFGSVVAVGDINGDLFDDVLVGAPKAPNYGERGAVFVILGGRDSYTSDGLVDQYWDEDGDGFGSGPLVRRCELLPGYSLNNEDCDDANANMWAPGHLEVCGNPVDEDCASSNADLCLPRFGLTNTDIPVGPPLVGSTWCYADASWPIGPAGETASIEGLATLLDEGDLFFGGLDDAMNISRAALSSCTNGVRVRMDVFSNYAGDTPEEQDAALVAAYGPVLTDVVIDTLRNHPAGYFIANLSTDPVDPEILLLGADYPGLVNGAVEILRATEGGAAWRWWSVLDWPENRQRRMRSLDDTLAGVPSSDWKMTTAGATAKESIDLALLYHFSAVRGGLRAAYGAKQEAWFERTGFANAGAELDNQIRYLVDMIKYLRVRGIDYDPLFGVAPLDVTYENYLEANPAANANPYEALGVERLPVTAVEMEEAAGGTGRFYAFPCDGDECPAAQETESDPVDPTSVGYVVSRKYAMSLDAGDSEGVVFAKNMVGTSFVGAVCDVSAALANCEAGDPCFCASAGSQIVDDTLTLSPYGTATLPFTDWTNPEADPVGEEAHDDSWYDVWGEDAFRPGRLYALHFHASDPDAAALPTNESHKLTVSMPGAVTVATDVLFTPLIPAVPAQGATPARAEVPADLSRNVSFVFRAPLQDTELPTGEPRAWAAPPKIVIQAGPGATVQITDLTVVELDGLSTGWRLDNGASVGLRTDDSLNPAFMVEGVSHASDLPVGGAAATGWTADMDSEGTPSCAAAGCVPYSYAPLGCAGYDTTVFVERYEDQAAPTLAVDHMTRIRLPAPSFAGETLYVSGVVNSIVGSYPVNPIVELSPPPAPRVCSFTMDRHAKASPQVADVLDPLYWSRDPDLAGGEAPGLPSQLKFIAKDRSPLLGDHSIGDYLFGPRKTEAGADVWNADTNYAWHTDKDAVYTNIATEIRAWNRGFPAWRDGVYRAIPQHQLARALFCNLANVVDQPDWEGTEVAARTFCEFSGGVAGCEDDLEPLSLASGQRCSLDGDGAFAGSSHVRVAIDGNMEEDANILNYRGDKQTVNGSLSGGYFQADISRDHPTRISNETVANTVAPNVDRLVWSYWASSQDQLENLCDVTDLHGLFIDQPGLFYLGATNESSNACAMSLPDNGRMPSGLDPYPYATRVTSSDTIDGNVYTAATLSDMPGLSVESVRFQAEFAAGHPDVVRGVEVNTFGDCDGCDHDDDAGGANPPEIDDPLWGYAGRCLWNPGWTNLATVSVAAAFDPASALKNRWCPSESGWASTYEAANPTTDYRKCGDEGSKSLNSVDLMDCAVGVGSGPLRMAVQPDLRHAIRLPSDAAGRSVRIETSTAFSVAPFEHPSSCAVSKAFETTELLRPAPYEPYSLTGNARGAIFFLTDRGQLLDSLGEVVSYGSPTGCSDPRLPSLVPSSVRPLMNVYDEDYTVVVSWEDIVPQRAAFVGFVVELPNASAPPFGDEWGPAIGAVDISLSTDTDPAFSPSTAYSASFPFGPGIAAFGDWTTLPRRCDDPRWFKVSAFKDPVNASCFQHFAEESP